MRHLQVRGFCELYLFDVCVRINNTVTYRLNCVNGKKEFRSSMIWGNDLCDSICWINPFIIVFFNFKWIVIAWSGS